MKCYKCNKEIIGTITKSKGIVLCSDCYCGDPKSSSTKQISRAGEFLGAF